MQEFRADLHCHSIFSDGTYSPEELIKKALEIGLKGLSITDHDTVEAYQIATPLARELGLKLLSGVEFSTVLFGVSVHILGYGFQLDHPALLSLCERHAKRRKERNQSILENLTKLGMPLEWKDITPVGKHATIGRPHIAQALVNKGFAENISDAFKKYLAEGKPAFSKGEPFSVEETLDILRQAKGKAIIAHPHLIEDKEILRRLLKMNFDGIEGYYANFQKNQNSRWLLVAEKKGWLITGGSDFHGEVKPQISLGASWVGEETFNRLLP